MNKIVLSTFFLVIVAACYAQSNPDPTDRPTDLVSLLQGKTLKQELNQFKLATGIGDTITSIVNFFLRIAGFFISPVLGIVVSILDSLSLSTIPLFDLWYEITVLIRKYFQEVGTSTEEATAYFQ